MSWGDFFYMNGYAFYVWGSYGVALFVFLLEIWLVRNRRRNALRELRLMQLDTAGEGERA